tara:strand:+ start:1300 stop:1947 length:648 start_codon:yes stop_codon:yes gene_type:complete
MTTYITQEQAEKLAHRRATKYVHRTAPLYCSYAFVPHTLMDFVRDIEAAAIQHYRDSLVAGVVLPPMPDFQYANENGALYGRISMEHYARQAIADALCVAEKETAELRLYKHNMEARFKGLNNMLKDALAKQVPQWQPIETAPKDGTWILVGGGETDDEEEARGIAVASWTRELNGSVGDRYARWQFAVYDGGHYGNYINPTHWMPLPQPPQEGA